VGWDVKFSASICIFIGQQRDMHLVHLLVILSHTATNT